MEYKYRGAEVLVTLHDEQMRRFLDTWRKAKHTGVQLPAVDDPDYSSLESLLGHVLRWARTYICWICEHLDLPDPGIPPLPDGGVTDANVDPYVTRLLDGWKIPLRDVEGRRIFRSEFVAPWGTRHSIEAMLEHAVMHPLRHRFQLEELMGLRDGKTPGRSN